MDPYFRTQKQQLSGTMFDDTQRDEEAVAAGKAIAPSDPSVNDEDKPRLTGQNNAILMALKSGPQTNIELAAIALKYTSRISDLRAAGHRITNERGVNGVTTYTLA